MNHKQLEDYVKHVRFLDSSIFQAQQHARRCVELADMQTDKTARDTYQNVVESLQEIETTLDVLDGIESGY